MKIKFKIEGIHQLARQLKDILPEEVRKELAKEVRKEANEIRKIAQSKVPVGSGMMKNDIKVRTSQRGLNASVGVFSKDRGYIARFVELGTRPHEIKPHKKRALYIGGRFAEKIDHPGAKPKPFLLDTQERRAAFQEKLRQKLLEVLRELNK